MAVGGILLAIIQNSLNLRQLSACWLKAVYGAAIVLAVVVDELANRRPQSRTIRKDVAWTTS